MRTEGIQENQHLMKTAFLESKQNGVTFEYPLSGAGDLKLSPFGLSAVNACLVSCFRDMELRVRLQESVVWIKS